MTLPVQSAQEAIQFIFLLPYERRPRPETSSVAQEASLDGAVIVTTPQKLSFVDVVRGIEMFDNLSVPVVSGVVCGDV